MDSNRRVRAAAFAVWAALLVLLAAAILRTTDLGATLAKALTPAPTATTAPPTPTPVPLHTYHIPISIGQYGDLIAWPYGPLWLNYSGGLERIDVQGNNLNNPVLTPYPVPNGVNGICLGPDGAVWFTEAKAAKIGRISSDGTIQEFALPNPADKGGSITAGSDGALWFSLPNYIGRISMAGDVSEFPLPIADSADDLTAGPDGSIWFLDSHAKSIGRMTLAGGVTEFAIRSGHGDFYGLVAGPDGALWFTEGPWAIVGRITTSGQVTEFPTPEGVNGQFDWLSGITIGPDKALWFAESTSHRIGRMTAGGEVTNEYRVSPQTKLGAFFAITSTSNAIWFTDPDAGVLGSIAVK